MERQNTLIKQMGELLTSFKKAQVEHMGYSRMTHEICAANFFRWHNDDLAADQLEKET